MFARTERLLLRPGWPEDAPALHAGIGEAAVIRNLARAPWPYALQDAERFCRQGFGGALPSFFILKRTQAEPELIGGVGLGPDPAGGIELGYWIRSDEWGRGYATEAARAVVALARDSLRLPRIQAGHFTDNPASGRVLQKLGFRPAGAVTMRYSVGRGGQASFAPYALPLSEANGMTRHTSFG